MATRYWQDVSGDWEAVANWSGATVPIAADTVVIDDGDQDIDINLNQAALSVTLHVGAGFKGTIGGVGNPLKIGVTEGWISNNGAFYLEGATAQALDVLHIDRSSLASKLILSSFMASVNILRGNVEIAANANSDGSIVVRSMFVNRRDVDARIEIGTGATNLTTVDMAGGAAVLRSACTTVYMTHGRLQHLLGAITTIHQSGGVFYYEADETITTWYGRAGKGDATRNRNAIAVPTITNLYAYPGFVVDLRNGLRNIVVTNTYKHGSADIFQDTTPEI